MKNNNFKKNKISKYFSPDIFKIIKNKESYTAQYLIKELQ